MRHVHYNFCIIRSIFLPADMTRDMYLLRETDVTKGLPITFYTTSTDADQIYS